MSHRVRVGVCCCVCVCSVCLFNKVNFGCSRGERPPNVFSHVLILPHLQWRAKKKQAQIKHHFIQKEKNGFNFAYEIIYHLDVT